MPFFRVGNKKTKLLNVTLGKFMITKNKIWKLIVDEMIISERSKKITSEILEKIKDIPQYEDKTRET
jgi:hypothetical protein|tara:strand:- start:1173 stop:1373 length:201 start_codon:yes stop_codon:yes gene_type:complete